MCKLKELVFATLNNNKVKEFKSMCSNYKVNVYSAKNYINHLPEEIGKTFEENAEIKAKYVGKVTNLPCLADDSGLCIDALNGDPGIYSARWAGEEQDYNRAIRKIYKKLENSTNYNAKFVSVLALYMPEVNTTYYFRGEIEGKLFFPPSGNNGFAYDVIFVPDGYNLTFAEMSSSLKNSISHRSKAFKLFAEKCLQKK